MAMIGPEMWIDGGPIGLNGHSGLWLDVDRDRFVGTFDNTGDNVSESPFTLLNSYVENVRRVLLPSESERQLDFIRDNNVPTLPIMPESEQGFFKTFADTFRAFKHGLLKCGCAGETVASWEREQVFRKAVRREMLIVDELCENVTTEQYVADFTHNSNVEVVHHIPKLVANVVVALRCKLGLQAMDRKVPGNVVLVRSEAARMLRDWNVRNKDAAAHLHLIEKYFFDDNTHYHISTWRARHSRRSRFVKWVLGKEDDVSFDF